MDYKDDRVLLWLLRKLAAGSMDLEDENNALSAELHDSYVRESELMKKNNELLFGRENEEVSN